MMNNTEAADMYVPREVLIKRYLDGRTEEQLESPTPEASKAVPRLRPSEKLVLGCINADVHN